MCVCVYACVYVCVCVCVRCMYCFFAMKKERVTITSSLCVMNGMWCVCMCVCVSECMCVVIMYLIIIICCTCCITLCKMLQCPYDHHSHCYHHNTTTKTIIIITIIIIINSDHKTKYSKMSQFSNPNASIGTFPATKHSHSPQT